MHVRPSVSAVDENCLEGGAWREKKGNLMKKNEKTKTNFWVWPGENELNIRGSILRPRRRRKVADAVHGSAPQRCLKKRAPSNYPVENSGHYMIIMMWKTNRKCEGKKRKKEQKIIGMEKARKLSPPWQEGHLSFSCFHRLSFFNEIASSSPRKILS